MNVIINRKPWTSMLVLTVSDFDKSETEVEQLTAHRGHRFDVVILPEQFKDSFKSTFLFRYLRGTMCVCTDIKSKLIYY